MHYLGREYMYYGKYNKAIDTLIKHLKLDSATWKDERAASMRFIAILYNLLDDYNKVIYYTNKALKINKKEKTYINEVFSYNSTAYDLRSIAYYYLGKYKASLKNIKKAITMEPNNERFISNKKIIEDKLK